MKCTLRGINHRGRPVDIVVSNQWIGIDVMNVPLGKYNK